MKEIYSKEVSKVIEVKLDDLTPHPESQKIYLNNSAKKEIKILAKTMKSVGQLEPIVINQTNQIISGVRRYKAAYFLGWTKIKAIRETTTPENEIVSIVYHNQQRKKKPIEIINEAEAILGILGKSQGKRRDLLKEEKDNPFGVIGKDRFEKAANVIGDISASTLRRLMEVVEFEKSSTKNKDLGLVERVIKNEIPASRAHTMMKSFIKENEERASIKKDKKPIILTNDDVQMYNKSSNKMNEVKSGSVQVVFTSPPYYNLRTYNNSKDGRPELGHESTPKEFVLNLSKHLKDVHRVLNKRGSFFLNIGETFNKRENLLIPTRLVLNLCDKEGWFIVNEIIWRKTNALPQADNRRLQPTYEKIFHLVKDPDKYYYEEFKLWNDNEVKLVTGPSGGRTVSTNENKKGKLTLSKSYQKFKDFIEEQTVRNVITGPNAGLRQSDLKKIDSTKDHPALMPDYLPIIPILTTSKEGDIILDPFSGSATTGKIALILGRKYIGYELNKNNYDLSLLDLNKTIQELSKPKVEIAVFD